MLSGKDLLAQFKAASWARPEDVASFIAALGSLAPQDLLKLLEIALAKGGDAAAQRARFTVFALLVEKNPDKSLFVPVVKALKTQDPTVRTALAPVAVRVNSPTEHAELVAHLRSSDAQLRQVSARVVMQIGGSKTTFDMLSAMAGEPNFVGRAEALDALVSFAKTQAVPALQAALAVGNQADKVLALKHLGDPKAMGKDPAPALKVLATALQGHPEPLTVQAIASFAQLCSEDDYWEFVSPFLDDDVIPYVKAAVEGLRRFSSPRGIAALERKMRAGPRTIRLAVLNTLEAIASDAVLPPLIGALGHSHVAIRNRAAEVLKTLSLQGKLDISRTIVWLLRSRDVNVRRMATDVIRSVPDPEATLWPKLMAYLRDEDWWVRERVMEAVIELGGVQLTAHMVRYLSDKSEVIRRFGASVLGRIKDAKALRALVQTASSDLDWWVREAAIEAIAAINDVRAVPYVAAMLTADPDLQPICLQALIDMQAKSAAPHVTPMLRADNADVRLLAITYLAKFDCSEHAAAVAKLGDDPHPRVRAAARELMTRWRVQSTGAELALLDQLLVQLARAEGDDLIVAPGRLVYMKKVGRTIAVTDQALTEEQVRALLLPHLTADQIIALQALQDVDYSHEVKSEGLRFRANIFQQIGGISGVFRRIKAQLPDIKTLGLPSVVHSFPDLKNGLVLVGGPTGSGKSTTLAALIDSINRTASRHIISLEDPIEVVHRRKMSLVNQREIGTHTDSFAAALRSTLREDPNVILVGEIRDLATIEFTVIAAETGHLVFGTVHTVSAATTVDRLISAFPPGQQEQVRATLADSLRAVICQYLLKTKDGQGRCLAVEVMLNNEAVSNLIRKGKAFQIPSVIATSRELGMQLMDQDLMRLYKEGKISAEDAYVKATSKKEFEPFLDGEVPKAPPVQERPTAPPQRPVTRPPVPPKPAVKPTGS